MKKNKMKRRSKCSTKCQRDKFKKLVGQPKTDKKKPSKVVKAFEKHMVKK